MIGLGGEVTKRGKDFHPTTPTVSQKLPCTSDAGGGEGGSIRGRVDASYLWEQLEKGYGKERGVKARDPDALNGRKVSAATTGTIGGGGHQTSEEF